jgi:hypothetical protein
MVARGAAARARHLAARRRTSSCVRQSVGRGCLASLAQRHASLLPKALACVAALERSGQHSLEARARAIRKRLARGLLDTGDLTLHTSTSKRE